MKKSEEDNINVRDVKKLIDLFGKLDAQKKELAIAALTGMVLIAEIDKRKETGNNPKNDSQNTPKNTSEDAQKTLQKPE